MVELSPVKMKALPGPDAENICCHLNGLIHIKAMDEGGGKKPFPSEPLITLQYETSLYKVWVQTTFDSDRGPL